MKVRDRAWPCKNVRVCVYHGEPHLDTPVESWLKLAPIFGSGLGNYVWRITPPQWHVCLLCSIETSTLQEKNPTIIHAMGL